MVPILLSGGPYERGFQFGSKLKDPTLHFYQDGLAHINYVRNIPLSLESSIRFIKPYIAMIEKFLPEIATEVAGLSDALGISYEEGMLLQLRRELIGMGQECSLLAYRNLEEGAVIAQNVDLPGNLLGKFFVIQSNFATVKTLQLCHYGLLSFLGMNNLGLAIGINMVLSDGWTPGVPPYLIIKHLLTLSSVDECLDELKQIPRSSSRCFTIADSKKIVCVEMTVQDMRIFQQEPLLHTNHFLHRDFRPLDKIPEGACTYSRLEILKKASRKEKLCNATVRNILKSHGRKGSICLHAKSTQEPETVCSVIMTPKHRTLSVSLGKPCQIEFQNYTFLEDFNE